MLIPQKGLDVPPQAGECRRFRRVRVDLLGCFMLSDRREYPCQVQDMSPGGMLVAAPISGRIGERVVAYVDHLGRLEGTIVRVHPTGFAMTIASTRRRREKLAAQLTWLANREILDLPEERRHERIVPRDPRCIMVLPNGIPVTCWIVQMSVSGAAVASETKPPAGTLVRLGKIEGRVMRLTDVGFAVEFTYLQDPNFLEERVSAR
jgi:hypothetical protein